MSICRICRQLCAQRRDHPQIIQIIHIMQIIQIIWIIQILHVMQIIQIIRVTQIIRIMQIIQIIQIIPVIQMSQIISTWWPRTLRADKKLVRMICMIQLMLAEREPFSLHCLQYLYEMFPGLHLYHTDPAQHRLPRCSIS